MNALCFISGHQRRNHLSVTNVLLSSGILLNETTHDEMTQSQRKKRQCTNSHVTFNVLSPTSQKARVNNMRKTIKNMQSKVEYCSKRIERLSANEDQNTEAGQLIDAVVSNDEGCRMLDEIYSEAERVKVGLGNVIRDNWDTDYSEWHQFKIDQETNGM